MEGECYCCGDVFPSSELRQLRDEDGNWCVACAKSVTGPQTPQQHTSTHHDAQTPVVKISRTIPQSPFLQRLGTGSGVSVYLIPHVASPTSGMLRSPWAAKKIQRALDPNRRALFESRLKSEAQLLQSLEHPCIVGFRGICRENGSLMLLMECAGDQSLYDVIQKREEAQEGPFPPDCIRVVAESISSALAYLHDSKRVLHGDMKSSNVIVRGDFEAVKVCDVGVAIRLDSEGVALPSEPGYIGTEPWTSREVVEGGPATPAADLYAFGLTLWEMLSLTVPHVHLLCPPTTGSSSSISSRESMCSTLSNLSESEYEERYQSALGSQPAIPVGLGPEYREIVELVCALTQPDPQQRPRAAVVLAALTGDGTA